MSGQPPLFEVIRHRPSPRLAGLVSDMCGYRETAGLPFALCEAASLVVPLIISFGTPFRIALGPDPAAAEPRSSFAAGLYAGPVQIASDGAAECVQVDFTPFGAYRLFGGGVVELAARMVDIDDVLGHAGHALREHLGATRDWAGRFTLVEQFVADRLLHQPSPEIAHAYRRLEQQAGNLRITDLAREIGWSRKHFAHRFRAETGLGPKTIARIMRFQRACRLARTGAQRDWAALSGASGYADQAHMVREFTALAGESPAAWRRRIAQAGTLQPRSADLPDPG